MLSLAAETTFKCKHSQGGAELCMCSDILSVICVMMHGFVCGYRSKRKWRLDFVATDTEKMMNISEIVTTDTVHTTKLAMSCLMQFADPTAGVLGIV